MEGKWGQKVRRFRGESVGSQRRWVTCSVVTIWAVLGQVCGWLGRSVVVSGIFGVKDFGSRHGQVARRVAVNGCAARVRWLRFRVSF